MPTTACEHTMCMQPDDIRSLTCVRETEQDRQEQLKQQQQQQQQAGGVVAPSAAPTQQVPTTSTSVEQTAPPSSSQVPAAQQPGRRGCQPCSQPSNSLLAWLQFPYCPVHEHQHANCMCVGDVVTCRG
jgi:hypothetical protein